MEGRGSCPRPSMSQTTGRSDMTQRTKGQNQPLVGRMVDLMRVQPNGCIWLDLQPSSHGYAVIWVEGRPTRAHRAAFEYFVGPIPEGLVVDHECHNADETCVGGPTCLHRRCVNPEHLRLATTAENLAASSRTMVGIGLRRTHCPQGHELTPENVYWRPGGRAKECRMCRKVARRPRGLEPPDVER